MNNLVKSALSRSFITAGKSLGSIINNTAKLAPVALDSLSAKALSDKNNAIASQRRNLGALFAVKPVESIPINVTLPSTSVDSLNSRKNESDNKIKNMFTGTGLVNNALAGAGLVLTGAYLLSKAEKANSVQAL